MVDVLSTILELVESIQVLCKLELTGLGFISLQEGPTSFLAPRSAQVHHATLAMPMGCVLLDLRIEGKTTVPASLHSATIHHAPSPTFSAAIITGKWATLNLWAGMHRNGK